MEKRIVEIIAEITGDELSYLDARRKAEQSAEKHGLRVATLPEIIDALHIPIIRETIIPYIMGVRSTHLDTVSIEMVGKRRNAHVYEVSHRNCRLSNLEGLEEEWVKSDSNNIMPVTDWDDIARTQNYIHLNEIKEGAEPSGDYTITVRVNKDKPIFLKDYLSYGEWMVDDRVLMCCGTLSKREYLSEILYPVEGREKRRIRNRSIMDIAGFEKNIGCPILLLRLNDGISCNSFFSPLGIFLSVGNRAIGNSYTSAAAEEANFHLISFPETVERLKKDIYTLSCQLNNDF